MNIIEWRDSRPTEADIAGIVIERIEPRFDKAEPLPLTLRLLGHITNLNENGLKSPWEVLEHLGAGNQIEMPSGTLYRQIGWEDAQ